MMRRMMSPPEREAGFLQAVKEAAMALQWRVYHTYRSDRSDAGWPDCAMVKHGTLIVAELKTGRNRPQVAQWEWLTALANCAGIDVFLWYPKHWGAIEARLNGRGCQAHFIVPQRFSRQDARVAWVCNLCGQVRGF